jgi:hypothetical protein
MDSTIFGKEHFKTLIQFKDYLKFENILYENRISFYSEEISNTNIANFRRYYFLQENYQKIESILNENEIFSVNENYGVSDLQQSKKFFKIYIIILMILFVIFFGIYFIFKIFN